MSSKAGNREWGIGSRVAARNLSFLRNKSCFISSIPHSPLSILNLVFVWLAVIFLTSCSAEKLEVREFPIERDGQRIAVVKAEIARTPEERSQGLMYRDKLPDGEGMLFVFERDEVLSFWMKNTYIPLSIAYITSDGRIADIKDMYPNDESSVVSSRSVRYALEVPQGWFLRAGVRVGDFVILEAIRN